MTVTGLIWHFFLRQLLWMQMKLVSRYHLTTLEPPLMAGVSFHYPRLPFVCHYHTEVATCTPNWCDENIVATAQVLLMWNAQLCAQSYKQCKAFSYCLAGLLQPLLYPDSSFDGVGIDH